MSDALRQIAARLRDEETPISPHVIDPDGKSEFSPPGEHAYAIEAIREGYLLHYAEPRLLAGHDADLALLAGDYLYALGIERLAALGDAEPVHRLANLISTCAQLHTEGRDDDVPGEWERTVQSLSR